MNKIYKLVWSKVKGAWVVTSEIAKGHGKSVASQQRKFIAAVMAVLALGFIPGAAYAAIDGVKTFVEAGNQNVKIGNGISLRNNNGKNGAVAIGDHVQIDDYVMQEGSVAIGKNAFVENMWGNQEKFFKFSQEDTTKWASSIAIGQNAYARSGSTMIGDHKYIGKLGDTEVDGSNVLKVKSKNVNINATTIGANSYNQGAFSSVLGTYSIISGKYNGSNWSSSVTQNMGASIVGSLNSIESASSSSNLSGIANSVVGIANRTNNANGALIFGAGNEIENSIGTLSGIDMFTGGGASAKDFADTLRKTVKSSNGGGAVLAIGGGNKANYAKASQLMGVNNTLTGTENTASGYNLLNGFKNVGTNISHVSVIGSENQVTDTKNALVFGDKRKLTKANGSVVLGVSDTVKEIKVEDVTVIGHNALATGANAVAIGHAASADSFSTVAIGDGAKVESNTSLSGGVAIGKSAYVLNGVGRQERYLGFGTTNDPQRAATGVAIGANAYARTGSIQIGAHTYLGKMGGADITAKTNGEGNHINQTTVGTNTFNKGVFGTMIGSYSISTGGFTGAGGFNSLSYGGQNFGSTIAGSLNTIQSKGHSGSAGISNSIVGLANMTENTNGTLIFGAGNKVTNSIKSISGLPNGVTSGAATPDELIEKLRKMTIDNESGGSTMVVGGGNTADYTRASQIMGVNNTLTGTKDKVSTHNLVDGFKNKAENVSHVTMIGSDNEVKDTTGAVLLGDKRKLTGADGSIVLGSADESAETNVKDATVIGHNANTTVASGVALGSDSVADRGKADAATVYLNTDKGVKATVKGDLAAVSVGNANATRQITGVAAGTENTDAVNVAQLRAVEKIAKAKTKIEAGDNITVTPDKKNGTYTLSATNTYTTGGTYDATTKKLTFTRNDNQTYDVNLADFVGNVTDTRNTIVDSDTVTVEAKAQEDGSNEYKLNVKADGKIEKGNTGIVTGGTVYNETRIEKDGNYIKAGNTAGQNLTALDEQVGANTT
ncbi:ESPR-type extended signal peptide-containing protein, partial [Negativicoccus succinicivorans]|uniref:ESPR-type extended signal peptide-containing protein n=1 Tax=Negativicoccus succinicivorans TaxID=620903 RepID=UPI0029118BF6